MKSSSVDRRARRAAGHVESLEARCLLSATTTSQIPSQTVFAGQSPTLNLGTFFNDPTITGTTLLMQTTNGNIPIMMFDSRTPITVANFLKYVDLGEYANTLIHRAVPGFVDQGGGFNTSLQPIATFGMIQNEPGISNTRGTIAMAKLGGNPNSATDQWFINEGDNSANLDAQNGGFTVFAEVLYNGMTTADAINNLPTTTVTSTDGETLDGFPLQNANGGNTPSNYVVVNSVSRVSALSYSVTVADPSVLSATVTNGTLSLTPAAGVASGSTNVTVTATDLGGGTTSSTFAVNVSSGNTASVTIGTGAAKAVTYTDSNGTTATLSLKGAGTTTVNFAGSALVTHTNKNKTVTLSSTTASISSITTTGTGGASTLTVTTKGDTRGINVGSITTDGLKSIAARGVTLTGDLTSTSSIAQVALAGATGGTLTLDSLGSFTATGGVSDNVTLTNAGASLGKFSASFITGGTWLVAGNVKSITAGSVSNWSPDFSGSVASLTVKKGDLNGTVTAVALGSVKIHGNLSNSTFQLTGSGNDLANFSVTGQISSSTINATGRLGNISAAALTNSQIYAGIGNLVVNQPLPNFPSEFVTNQSIASVKLKVVAGRNSFFNSDIAAQTLGKLQLGTILTNNGGIVTGVASENIKLFNATFAPKHATLKNLTSATDLTTILVKLNVELGDFVIKLF